MKIKKVKYFTFLLVSFLMTKIFCNSPIEMSENNYSFELQYEIERIEKIKSQLKEKNLQTEINYLRFLEQQIKMIIVRSYWVPFSIFLISLSIKTNPAIIIVKSTIGSAHQTADAPNNCGNRSIAGTNNTN